MQEELKHTIPQPSHKIPTLNFAYQLCATILPTDHFSIFPQIITSYTINQGYFSSEALSGFD
uniref:Uncharacterized protein n=1 Tax=Prolemur simus TaxID=1328070 RepID=A0A8C9AA34_PROSS